MRALGIDPVHGTRTAFRALLSAMSRPGTVEPAPERADHAVAAALVDHEVAFATDDERLREALATEGRLEASEPAAADMVHATDPAFVDLAECKRGSLVEPSEGATVVYHVDALADGATDGLATVTLSGPGVDGTASLSVDLPAAELEAVDEAGSSFPRGVDAVFATDDAVAAVPRSATVESLEVA
ncbi:phosphonate C-P lyase system protein PhnH [Haloarcula sediminis]|uniref:phosphonate C-P lyase system protein PhnH n=1 Tax=Haloarcula sediminis TaxID=3111777 RepID=UPI002D791711|nr:phosphonate C-P lyase system protein PhnH [Haloarcula sp. CK38]